MHHNLQRPIFVGAAAALLATTVLVQATPGAEADEVALPSGLELPVPAAVVSQSDTSLANTSSEVVALVTTGTGPEVVKLRAASQARARELAAGLDAQPGVTAAVNEARALVPEPVGTDSTQSGKSARQVVAVASVGLKSQASERTASALTALSAEAYGARQWGLAAVNAEPAWAITRGAGLQVAVLDTGVDASHPDLAGRVNPQIDVLGDGLTGDPAGHGTHVAGIIAASLDGSGVAGLANRVSLLPVRVLNAQGVGDSYTIAVGIVSAVDAGAKVLNMSYGGAYSELEAAAVQYAVDSGVTVVAAGGNSYLEGNPAEFPAALPNVLAVSSIGPEGTSSDWGTTGAFIDLTAPGEDIWSTIPGGSWAAADGTSVAAPFVSGAAALVRVANPLFTRSQVDATLTGTALDDESGNGRDDIFGSGLLQADAATAKAAKAPGGLLAHATVTVKAVSAKSKLFVDVNPNKGSGYWKFDVQKHKSNGSWAKVGTYKTSGSAETRTLDLPKGTYRVKVLAKYGLAGITSKSIKLVK